MRQGLSKLFSVLAALACCWSLVTGEARAAPTSAADAKAVRLVIQAQLNAFAADDAKRAFSYAAPSIRTVFETPERFLAMVRDSYPMVYRPGTVSFFKPELAKGGVIQVVKLSDLDGTEWVATYHLQRQRDKTWRISGCVIAPADSNLTT